MKLFVTGASGLLGTNLVLAAIDKGDKVFGASRRPMNSGSGFNTITEDIGQSDKFEQICCDLRPDWVLHCAAETNVDSCELDPSKAERANVLLTKAVVAGASAVGARVFYVSTDSVFSGDGGGFREEDPTGPVNHYARTKLAGERELDRLATGSLVLRTNLYGWNAQNKMSLGEWIFGRLERGEPVPGFTNVIFNPLLVNDLANMMLDLVEGEARGIFHAGARDYCSKFEFAVKLAEVFGFSSSQIERTSLAPATLRAPRPLNTWLRTERLAGFLKYQLPSVQEGLQRFAALAAQDHRLRLKSLLA